MRILTYNVLEREVRKWRKKRWAVRRLAKNP